MLLESCWRRLPCTKIREMGRGQREYSASFSCDKKQKTTQIVKVWVALLCFRAFYRVWIIRKRPHGWTPPSCSTFCSVFHFFSLEKPCDFKGLRDLKPANFLQFLPGRIQLGHSIGSRRDSFPAFYIVFQSCGCIGMSRSGSGQRDILRLVIYIC